MSRTLTGVSTDRDPAPISIAPPPTIKLAAVLVAVLSAGVVAFAAVSVASGLGGTNMAAGQVWAQGAYFLVLAAGLAAVAYGLLRGRRWARTPALVTAILTGAIGLWLAFPGEHLAWELALVLAALVTGFLLLCRPSTEWTKSFPALFGPES